MWHVHFRIFRLTL